MGFHTAQASTQRANVKHKPWLEHAVLVVYPFRMSLGNRIAARRKQLGLSQTALAELVGVGQTTISKWETDKSEPDRPEAQLLAAALKISHAELEGLTEAGKVVTIPLMGYVGTGAQVYGLGPQEIDHIELPPGAREGDVAFVIRGASMQPFAENGIIVARPISDISEALYRLAVVDLEDDRRFFKRLLPSPIPGHYVLARLDGGIEERDVKVTSVAVFRVYIEPN